MLEIKHMQTGLCVLTMFCTEHRCSAMLPKSSLARFSAASFSIAEYRRASMLCEVRLVDDPGENGPLRFSFARETPTAEAERANLRNIFIYSGVVVQQ
jgi:hypothetical protein